MMCGVGPGEGSTCHGMCRGQRGVPAGSEPATLPPGSSASLVGRPDTRSVHPTTSRHWLWLPGEAEASKTGRPRPLRRETFREGGQRGSQRGAPGSVGQMEMWPLGPHLGAPGSDTPSEGPMTCVYRALQGMGTQNQCRVPGGGGQGVPGEGGRGVPAAGHCGPTALLLVYFIAGGAPNTSPPCREGSGRHQGCVATRGQETPATLNLEGPTTSSPLPGVWSLGWSGAFGD